MPGTPGAPTTRTTSSTAFHTALGASLNPAFTNAGAACFAWEDNVFTMVIRREVFATFTDKPVGRAADAAQFRVAFSRDSRAAVDAVIGAGLAAGGTEHGKAHDDGVMYARDLADPDGDVVSVSFMAAQPAAAE